MVDLDKLVADYKIFVDTCSFMYEHAGEFFERHLPASLDRIKNSSDDGIQLMIPLQVGNELVKLQKSEDKSIHQSARRGIKTLNEYVKVGYAGIYGEPNDSSSFADNVFLTVFTRYRLKYNILLITQDSKLAQDILALRYCRAVRVDKGIKAFRINESGALEEWKKFVKPKPDNTPFTPSTSFDSPKNPTEILPISLIPTVNDEVTSDQLGGRLKLVEEIGKGGEGSIFTTDSKLICKIYKKEKLTDFMFNKLERMVSREINIPGVCWPRDIVYNQQGEFVGYAMEQARGKTIQRAMFVRPLLEQNFPQWERKNLVDLAITILKKIKMLNELNIIIGDINPLNILIQSSQEIYFVDTDSYQIEDFPCQVSMINFTAPEIQGQHFTKFLRTQAHENFAIATLLFMILMPGKPPYSQQGGGYPKELIKKQDFSYPLGKQANRKAPPGPWRFIWAHFPYQIKEAFYQNFKENQRKTAQEWLDIMVNYAKLLKKGYISSEIFPTGLKPYTPKEGDDGRTDEELICSVCGELFIFSVGEQRYYEERGFSSPERCPEHRAR